MSDESKTPSTEAPAVPEAPKTISGRAALILHRLDANPLAVGSDTVRDLAGLVAELAAVVQAQPPKEA